MRSEDRERAEFLAHAFGKFERFCALVDIVPKDPKLGRIKLQLNDIQKKFCRERTGRDLALKPRQIGFTTLEQARDVWHFLTVPGARVVATCQSLQDNTPLKLLSGNYRVMFDGLRKSGVELNFRNESASEWVLADRDASLRIIVAGASEASASKKGRAGTVTRLHLTETAYYEYADETLNALLECVPSPDTGSEIVSETTANGASGYFYRQWGAAESGLTGYKAHFYPWFDHWEYKTKLKPGETIKPENEREEKLVALGVTPEQLKWYRGKVLEKGQALADQEYPSDPETCFLISGRSFFEQAVTSRLLLLASEPAETRMSSRVRIYEPPRPGEDYVLGVDTSEGGGGDPSGAVMLKRSTGQHVATIDGQFQPWELASVAVGLCREYNNALLAPERNNHGHAVIQATLRELKYRRVYKHDDGKLGWLTNAVTRPVILDALEDAYRKGLWKSPDKRVLGQFRKFMINDKGKPEAARGEKDDLVIAAAIGWSVRAKPRRAKSELLIAKPQETGVY